MAGTKAPNSVDARVGARVRSARILFGLTQAQLGKLLAISYQQVMKYEHGTDRIGASRLQALASVLGQPVAYFFDQADRAEDRPFRARREQPQPDAIEGMEFTRAVARITDREVRQKVMALVVALASAG